MHKARGLRLEVTNDHLADAQCSLYTLTQKFLFTIETLRIDAQ
jgi:hypothetical protein